MSVGVSSENNVDGDSSDGNRLDVVNDGKEVNGGVPDRVDKNPLDSLSKESLGLGIRRVDVKASEDTTGEPKLTVSVTTLLITSDGSIAG